jgi:HD-like signal output (HDOD) protein
MNSYASSHPTQHPSTIPADDKQFQLEKAAKIVENVDELAVLPHVVFKVLELSGSSDNPAGDLEDAITIDPSFSAKLLAHANSSFYALSRKVTSVRDALVYLGFREVREMAMTVGVFDMFVGKNDKESLRRRTWWRQSLDAAIACRYVAQVTRRLEPAEAYTCGLLHCLGKTLLDRFGKADYGLVEQRVAIGATEIASERRIYGCDNETVALLAGRKWGLSAQMVASFQYSEKPERADDFPEYRACVAIGNMIARLALAGSNDLSMLPDWAVEELQIHPDALQSLYDGAIENISAATGMHF